MFVSQGLITRRSVTPGSGNRRPHADPYGIFQVDLHSTQVTHRQIPLSIDGNGGGCHGVTWHDGKLWIAALRLGGILRIDPTTWVPDVV